MGALYRTITSPP